MKAFFFAIVATLFTLSANADIITCGFTEPFLTTTYSMAQQSLTIKDDVSGESVVLKNVSFQIIAAGKFELRNQKGEVLQTLNLTNNGSDGRSDTVFPFEAVSSDKIQEFEGHKVIGVCTSNFLKTTQPQQ